ncbi:MAG: 50S ribosomal protein L30 [Nitrospiraceae bacterium]|nr:50S ribosomal protein L30 [Nitrospiraceae bacterium]
MIRIVQKRSVIGITPKQRKVLEALGLRKIGGSVVHKDDKAVQGMIHKVSHLVTVEKAD